MFHTYASDLFVKVNRGLAPTWQEQNATTVRGRHRHASERQSSTHEREKQQEEKNNGAGTNKKRVLFVHIRGDSAGVNSPQLRLQTLVLPSQLFDQP
jgi:hypothetical protein